MIIGNCYRVVKSFIRWKWYFVGDPVIAWMNASNRGWPVAREDDACYGQFGLLEAGIAVRVQLVSHPAVVV